MSPRGETIEGAQVPQANRIDKVLDRARSACAGESSWTGHDARDVGYYTQACTLLGLLDGDAHPTTAAVALQALNEAQALAAIALAFERSVVGQAWLAYGSARGLQELDETSAAPFLRDCANLAPSTAERRAATLRHWLLTLQPHAPAVAHPQRLSGTLAAFLHRELDHRLPTRMHNWAARNNVHTHRDLLRWSPTKLTAERNLGRGSIKQTRAIVEAAAKTTWEDITQALTHQLAPEHEEGADEDDSDSVTKDLPWDALRTRLHEWVLGSAVEDAALPTRMRNFCQREGITTIAQLVALPLDDLFNRPNLGRKSLREAREAVLALATNGTGEPLAVPPTPTLDAYEDVFGLLRGELLRLRPVDRLILTRRAGMHGATATLAEIGDMLGVSRERVRQLESRTLKALAARWWVAPLRTALEAQLHDGVRPVRELTQDAFFAPLAEQHEEFDYFLDRLYGDDLSIVDVNDEPMLVTGGRRQVAEAEADLLRTAKQLSFPVPEDFVVALAPRFANPIAAGLAPHFANALRARLVVVEGATGRMATGVGHTLVNAKLAYLEASTEPVLVADLEARYGGGPLPDEAIYVARGLVSLPKHVPDFYLWQRRLTRLCVAVMSAGDSARQWSTPQLLEEIEEQVQLPDWLGHWHLASMLRLGDQVEYRGRLRVALPSRDGEQGRVLVNDAAREALLAHGDTLPTDDLVATLANTLGATDVHARNALMRLPFVRVSGTHVGLADRDLPGGLEGVPAAIAALEAELEELQQGLAPVEALDTVHALGAPYTRWSLDMLLSVARAVGSLRTTISGAVGLAEWERERVPTYRSILLDLLTQNQGKAPVEHVQSVIEARFGAPLSRPSLNSLAHHLNARMDGAFILSESRASATTPPPRLELPDPASIPGFPLMAMATFTGFLREPVGDLAALTQRATDYVSQFVTAQQDNEFIDPDEARALAAASASLLAAVAADPDPNRRQLAWAAVRYFECADDGDNDFIIGGLDDDAAVMNAVASYLDLPHCTVAWT